MKIPHIDIRKDLCRALHSLGWNYIDHSALFLTVKFFKGNNELMVVIEKENLTLYLNGKKHPPIVYDSSCTYKKLRSILEKILTDGAL